MLKIELKLLNEAIYFKQMINQFIDKKIPYPGLHPKTQSVISELSNNQMKKYLIYLSNISKYPNHILIQPSADYLPFILFLLLHFIENKNQEIKEKYSNILFDGIMKLLENGCLSYEEIVIIFKVIILMSIIPRKEENAKIITSLTLKDIQNSKIKQFDVFFLSVDFIIKANNIKLTELFCSFCTSNIIRNKTNLYYLSNDTRMFLLLQVTTTNQPLNLLGQIYMNRYSRIFLHPFLENIKKALSTSNDSINSILPILKNQTNLLLQLNKYECQEFVDKGIRICKGFVINNTDNNGLTIPNIKIKSQFTLLFSFNFSPNDDDDNENEYPILLLKTENGGESEQVIAFSIHKNFFLISAIDVKNRHVSEIKHNTTYLVYFTIKDRDQSQVVIKSSKGVISQSYKIKSLLKKEFSMIIGKDSKGNFEGYIGSVFLFQTIFSEEFKNNFFALKGNYHIINHLSNYNTSFITKYIKELNDLSEENNNYKKAIVYFETNKEIQKNLICFITPPNYIKDYNKRVFINPYNTEYKEIYDTKPLIENEGIFFFENKNLIFEFLKYEGMNLLILNYELYTKLMNHTDLPQSTYNLIEMNICSLFDFTIAIFTQIDIEKYLKEIKAMFFCLQKYFHKVAETGKLKGAIFVKLNKWLETLGTQNPESPVRSLYITLRNQFSIFLLNYSLYNLKDYETLDYLFKTFINCIKHSKEGLATSSTMKNYLKFADIYNDFISSQLYKQVKKTYNNSITTFLKLIEKERSLPLYNSLLKTFYNKFDFGYKEYQMLQVFYLNAEKYYTYSSNQIKQKTTKYFIDLLERMDEKNNKKLTTKKKEIIKAICIRILLEYPLVDYFNIIEEKKRRDTRQFSVYYDNLQSGTTSNTEKIGSNQSGSSIECHSHHSSNDNMEEEPMKFLDIYCSFDNICQSIKKASDVMIKSLLLAIFDNGQLSTHSKLRFIKHCNKYSEFETYVYITLNEYSSETKGLFLPIVDLIEKNRQDLCLSYELFLYLTVHIAKKRYHNQCVFNHFLSSKKICSKVLFHAQHNLEAYELVQREFIELTRSIIPYHKASFMYHFVKSFFTVKGCEEQGFYFLNLLLRYQNSDTTSKYCYHYQMKMAQLLYEIFCHKKINKSNFVSLDCLGLTDLFKSDLTKTRFNILQNISNCTKKKTYLEVLFDILFKSIKLAKHKKEYEAILNKIFNVKDDLCTQNDTYYYSSNYKKLDAYKLFDDHYKEIKCPSIIAHFFMKYLICLVSESKLENMSENLLNIILALSSNIFDNAKILFHDKRKCRKTTSKICKLYNLVVDLINNSLKDITIDHDTLLFQFKEQLTHGKLDIKLRPEWFVNETMTNSISPPNEINNNSLLSCGSPKEQKSKCLLKKKAQGKRRQTTLNIPLSNIEAPIESERDLRSLPVFDISAINHSNEVILFPKTSLLMKVFGIYFKDVYFYNEIFTKMKKHYIHSFNSSVKPSPIDTSLNFPSCIKNYTPIKLYFKGLFLKQDLNFFSDNFFQYSHHYYMEYLTKTAKYEKKLFPQKKAIDLKVPLMKFDPLKKYYCELITNHGSFFGHIKLYSNFLYFENLNRNEETENLTDKEKTLFLFHSDKNDWSNEPKRILIFKKEIIQLFMRRFLQLFQAYEIFLINGKSYFFNFFTDQKSSDFIQEFDEYSIEIIKNPKDDFRKKEYTKKWLNSQISNIDYLLLINKYALRSYNDTSQYPVFPWLTLSGMIDRLLQYPTFAQTALQRENLNMRYEALVDNNNSLPSHFNLHFSSAFHLIFYLIRLNPFTNNQIQFQTDRLDSPQRQFHSIEDSLEGFKLQCDTRELLPEFFMTVEFFYNVNYVFFNYLSNGTLVHNIIPMNKMSPIEYYFDQRNKMNSTATRADLHKFIDQVFGNLQRQEQSYNIYQESTYQYVHSLTEILDKYTVCDDEVLFEEIKKKIDDQIGVYTMGQTPYKILEENHAVWSIENEKKQSDDFPDFNKLFNKKNKKHKMQIILNYKILCFSMHYLDKKHSICLLLKINQQDQKYGIKIVDTTFSNDKFKPIPITKKLSMLEKIKLEDGIIAYKYNPKYAMISFQLNYFIVCRFLDNSFMIISQNGDSRNMLTDSFITCIAKSNEESKDFITGHIDGRIIEWRFNEKKDEISWERSIDPFVMMRSLLAHEKEVSAIHIDDSLGLLITSGNDHYIYIRKYYDFGLLSVIQIKHCFLYEMKLNNNMLYALLYDEKVCKYIIKLFTLNGIELIKSSYDYYNNLDIDERGYVLVGLYNENSIIVYDQSLKVMSSCELEFNDKLERYFTNMAYIGGKHLVCTMSKDLLIKQKISENE